MTWWHYLLLVNFYLVLFFGFYALLLRRETFFQLNRVYLVAASLLSFIIPVIEADWVKNLFITQEVQHTIYNMPVAIPVIFAPAVNTGITLGKLLNIVYISVTLFLIGRLAWQLFVLKKAIEKPSPSAAYTFFKKISLGENVAQSKIIHDHEKVHAGQWHSVDVMIIETVMIINWFNPVVYLYRFAIKYIHEFIADNHVIQAGTDKADYAMLLLTQSFDVSNHSLVNQFYNHSLLKQRIQMLQKNKSHRVALAKYGLSAPLFILMMIFSSATINNSKAVAAITAKTQNALALPATEVIESIANNAQIPADNLMEEPKAIVELPFGLYDVEPVELPADMAPVDNSPIFSQVGRQPEFPGGLAAFTNFIGNTVIYPSTDRENGVSGKVVVSFIVERDGSLSNFKAARGPSDEIKAEAIRALKLSPKWLPGIQNDMPVRVSYTVPIAFMLEADDEQPEFPGGMQSFGKFLGNNIKYPIADRNARVQGKVFLTFVVEIDGTLADIKAVRSPSQTMADEAIRVLSKSPKWKPGTQKGKPVRATITVPVNFSLDYDDGSIIKPDNTPNAAAAGSLLANEVVIRGYVKRNANADDNVVFSQVEGQPSFPGGLAAFGKFLGDHIKYPKADRDAGRQGKVIVTFITERDGTLSEIKAVRGPSQAMMDETIRVLQLSPKWQPGYQNGYPVRVFYTVPIAFGLEEDKRPAGTWILPGSTSAEVTGSATAPDVAIRGYINKAPEVLYVVDGVVTDYASIAEVGKVGAGDTPLGKLKQEDIVGMEILRDGTALYGDRGKNGVILVTTKNGPKDANELARIKAIREGALAKLRSDLKPKATESNLKPVTKIRINGKTISPTTDPVSVVDGKIVGSRIIDGKRLTAMSFIPRENIKSMVVLSKEQAIKKYGYKFESGVNEIITYNGIDAKAAKPVTKVRINSKTATPTNPLYVVDGKIVNVDVKNGKRVSPLTKIPQANILRMEILHDEDAIKKYGAAGKNGVIIVTTKNAGKK
ncbi:MAG: TonB family protein [Bacteroidota bacterium]